MLHENQATEVVTGEVVNTPKNGKRHKVTVEDHTSKSSTAVVKVDKVQSAMARKMDEYDAELLEDSTFVDGLKVAHRKIRKLQASLSNQPESVIQRAMIKLAISLAREDK